MEPSGIDFGWREKTIIPCVAISTVQNPEAFLRRISGEALQAELSVIAKFRRTVHQTERYEGAWLPGGSAAICQIPGGRFCKIYSGRLHPGSANPQVVEDRHPVNRMLIRSSRFSECLIEERVRPLDDHKAGRAIRSGIADNRTRYAILRRPPGQ
jgi:hypothetical protein